MKVIRETCIAGAVIDRVIKCNSHVEGKQRAPRKNVTTESMKKYNHRERCRHCTRKVNSNFMPQDLHVVLTYRDEPASIEEAYNIEQNFIRRLRRAYKKHGMECKYFGVTEARNHRIHHHIIIPAIAYEEIAKTWNHGLINCTPLDNTRDYSRLVEYMLKETEETVAEFPNKKHYIASANLEEPVIVLQEVNASELGKEIKEIKGYYIDMNSVRRYESPVTGVEHVEYRMIAADVNNPRLKVWNHGKKKKSRESYIRFEQLKQQNLFDDFNYWMK